MGRDEAPYGPVLSAIALGLATLLRKALSQICRLDVKQHKQTQVEAVARVRANRKSRCSRISTIASRNKDSTRARIPGAA